MYFKIKNEDVAVAVGNVENMGSVGGFLFVKSDTPLDAPFEEVQDLPLEVQEQMKAGLESTKAKLLDEAKKIVSNITYFRSEVLGQEHWYDMQEQDQINLSQAREYLSLMPDAKVKIRCTDTNGVKDNVEHTKEQVNQLFEDWYVSKSAILNAFSTFKIGLENALSKSEAEALFEAFVESNMSISSTTNK